MNVTVAGANGFIGRAICAALLAQGDAVTALVRRADAAADLPAGVAALALPDHTDEAAARAQLPAGDCLIHAAGLAHALAGDHQLEAYRAANVAGPCALARAAAARGYRRMVFLSSIGVLGARDHGAPLDENAAPAPARPYAVSKLEAEQALFAIGRETGLEITVLRPPMVYGPGNGGNFPRLMRWVNSGLPLPLGAIDNARSYVYVGNLAAAALACAAHARAANRLFLVADERSYSTPAIVRLIAREMGRPARLWPLPLAALRLLGALTGKSREIGSLTDSLRIDAACLRQVTGWTPRFSTEEGVALTARWFLGQRAKDGR
ncbi:MAG TPA: NAD-dependent epimerase/dehydratase family protein [Burkholderiales bacterium]|jgi:UDP-glucose 4-epimerase